MSLTEFMLIAWMIIIIALISYFVFDKSLVAFYIGSLVGGIGATLWYSNLNHKGDSKHE